MTLNEFISGQLFMVSVRGDKGRMRTEPRFASAPINWLGIGLILGTVAGATIARLW